MVGRLDKYEAFDVKLVIGKNEGFVGEAIVLNSLLYKI